MAGLSTAEYAAVRAAIVHVLMLHGYDKGKDNSPTRQNKEIQRAQRMLRAWKVDQARNAKRKR